MENIDDLHIKLAECEEDKRKLSIRLEELTDFFENASLPLHWVNGEGKIIWANQAELDFLGYDKEEYFGYCIKDFHADEDTINDILNKLGNDHTLINYEATLKCKDGSVKHVLINSNVYKKDGKFIHTRCFTRDITELKNQQLKQEELLEALEAKNYELAESENRFRSLADSAPVMLWMSDTDKMSFFFNTPWLEFAGRTMEQEMGEGWADGVHPDDKEQCLSTYQRAFDAREEFRMEYRLRRHDGEYRWITDRGVPRFTSDGAFVGYVGSCIDIHEQKHFAKKLEEQVRQRTEELHKLNDLLVSNNAKLSHSNEELSAFSYAASHDLQAPLRKISTFSTFIINKDGENLSEDSRIYLERISMATKRMQELIDSLLNYSKIDVEQTVFEETDLNVLFAEVKNNLSDLLEESHATIDVQELPVLKVIPLQFQQLFVNLISNSLKYAKKDVVPVIRIGAQKAANQEIESLGGNPEKEYWKLTFADNGIGFEQQYADKIFELFHRLHGKNEYEGTGVGLGIVKKIILNHKGFVRATGNVGEGAVFEVFIPA